MLEFLTQPITLSLPLPIWIFAGILALIGLGIVIAFIFYFVKTFNNDRGLVV